MTSKDQKSHGVFAKMGREIGDLVELKNAQYGDSFAQSHAILKVLFPNGIAPEQYRDAMGVIRIIDKLFRVAHGSKGDESPGRDIAGYGILMAHNHEKEHLSPGNK